MHRLLVLFLCFATAAMAQRPARPAAAESGPTKVVESDATALGALAAIPKAVQAQVARVEGPEGRPFPERWYVLIHDPAEPRGLREFVVSQGKLVGGRTLSQFADTISADEVVGAAGVKVNSDEAAGIAAQFAMHNNVQIGAIHYELVKATAPAVPVWRLVCSGRNGEALGTIVLHAGKGSLLSFEGFAKSPIVPDTAALTAAPQPAATESAAAATTNKPPKKTTAATTGGGSTRSTANRESAAPPRATPVRRSPPPVRQGPVDRVGGFFRRVFRD